MSHYVICSVCGKRFDRDKVQAVKSSARRYAHQSCYPQGEIVPLSQVDEDLQKLNEYIDKLFKGKQNHAKVNQSIKKFHNELGYSYTGIQKALIYFYEVKHNSLDKANGGISIVPFIYQDAFNYYYSLWQAQNVNQTKHISALPKVKEVTIKLPVVERPMKLFFSGDDDEEDTNE